MPCILRLNHGFAPGLSVDSGAAFNALSFRLPVGECIGRLRDPLDEEASMKTARLWLRTGGWWRLACLMLFLLLLSSRMT